MTSQTELLTLIFYFLKFFELGTRCKKKISELLTRNEKVNKMFDFSVS